MKAVESLQYRVTVGDVAAKAGLNVEVAQQGLLALASETQAHLEVSNSGEIAYEFDKNFRGVLRNKYWQIRMKALLAKIWQVVFYLIRLSFGLFLLLSIALIFIAIFALMVAASSQGGNSRDDRDGGGFGGGFGFGFRRLISFIYLTLTMGGGDRATPIDLQTVAALAAHTVAHIKGAASSTF